jgi:hypothetical protein
MLSYLNLQAKICHYSVSILVIQASDSKAATPAFSSAKKEPGWLDEQNKA